MKRENTMLAVKRVIDWQNGEAYFAIVRGSEIVKRLRGCQNWAEAQAAYRAFRKAER